MLINNSDQKPGAMKNLLFLLLITFSLAACSNTDQNQQLNTEPKLQTQAQSDIDIKREKMKATAVGKPTPDATLLSPDSLPKSISEFKGKLLIIDFWATWCSPCLKEAPLFKEFKAQYENDKVQFISISVDDEFSFWQRFMAKKDWGADQYWYGTKEAEPFFAYMYSEMELEENTAVLIALPKYVFISPKGEILNNQAPQPSSPEFKKELEQVIQSYTS